MHTKNSGFIWRHTISLSHLSLPSLDRSVFEVTAWNPSQGPRNLLCLVCGKQLNVQMCRRFLPCRCVSNAQQYLSVHIPVKGAEQNIHKHLQAHVTLRKIETKVRGGLCKQEAVLQRYITLIFICTFFLIRQLGFNVTSISTLLFSRLKPISKRFPRARNL